MKIVILILIRIVAITYCLNMMAFAQWSTDPSENLQVSTWGMSPLACSDGNGGVYVLWYVNNYYTYQYLQRVDRYGYVRWSSPLIVKGEMSGTAFYRRDLSEDGFGGALVAFTEWEVDESTTPDNWPLRVRVSRIDSMGNFVWDSLGVRVSLKDTNQNIPQVVPDGEGGAFVSFGVMHGSILTGEEEDTLYIQHISAEGEQLWGDEGIIVTGDIHPNITHILISDRQGGAIVQWYGYDTGFKRFDREGNLLWYTPSPDPIYLYYNHMISDRNGGAVLADRKYSGAYRQIIANRISPNGVFLWGDEGVTVADSVGEYSGISDIAFRPDSVTVIFWTEVLDVNNDYQALIQMISPNGELLFDDEGIQPSLISVTKRSSLGVLASNGNNTVFLFSDNRDEPNRAVYTQKLSPRGVIMWDTNDVVFSYVSRRYISEISDGSGGLISIGSDEPLRGIFAHQVSRNGNLGEVLPRLNLISYPSVPNDFLLFQNYPNPFNKETVIGYRVLYRANIELSILNVLGEQVNCLVDEVKEPGLYRSVWNGTDRFGKQVSSGVYLYQLGTGDLRQVRKLVYLK